ncbi:hypothetical protein D3C81_1003110 [compost metagenome]
MEPAKLRSAKANDSIRLTVDGIPTTVSLEPSNAPNPIDSSPSGKSMFLIPDPKNANLGTLFKSLGSLTSLSFEVLINAFSPIPLTPSGKSIFVIDEDPNALKSSSWNPGLNVTSVSFWLPENAYRPIYFTFFGMLISVLLLHANASSSIRSTESGSTTLVNLLEL